MSDFSKHPLFADRLARLRSQGCPPQEFRKHVTDIAKLMVLPATSELPTRQQKITTPDSRDHGLPAGKACHFGSDSPSGLSDQ